MERILAFADMVSGFGDVGSRILQSAIYLPAGEEAGGCQNRVRFYLSSHDVDAIMLGRKASKRICRRVRLTHGGKNEKKRR